MTRRYYPNLHAPLPDRVRDRIVVADETGCWEWQGTLAKGYGYIHYNGRKHATHRVMYAEAKGEIPEGLHIDHLCEGCRMTPTDAEIATEMAWTSWTESCRDMAITADSSLRQCRRRAGHTGDCASGHGAGLRRWTK